MLGTLEHSTAALSEITVGLSHTTRQLGTSRCWRTRTREEVSSPNEFSATLRAGSSSETRRFQGVMKWQRKQCDIAMRGSCRRAQHPGKGIGRSHRIAIPREGYFTLEKGRYGPTFPKT